MAGRSASTWKVAPLELSLMGTATGGQVGAHYKPRVGVRIGHPPPKDNASFSAGVARSQIGFVSQAARRRRRVPLRLVPLNLILRVELVWAEVRDFAVVFVCR